MIIPGISVAQKVGPLPGEVSEGGGTGQVQLLTGIVGQHPGEHGVLHQVVVGPARQRVQAHQVLQQSGIYIFTIILVLFYGFFCNLNVNLISNNF